MIDITETSAASVRPETMRFNRREKTGGFKNNNFHNK